MIYLLEDDDSIRKLVVYTLQSQGFEAQGFCVPNEFDEAMEKELPQLILLDIMLPFEDGISILKRLKASSKTRDIPVIMLTAKNSEYDRVIGLDMGADDFISKPFGMMELVARIKAVLRRSTPQKKPHSYNIEGLYVCPQEHIVKLNGEEIALTYKEFEILTMLFVNRNIVVSRNDMMDEIWGYGFEIETERWMFI